MASDPIQSLSEELPLHAAWLRRLARKLVSDEAAAEDLAQETVLASLTTRRPIRGPLQPWLARVVANLARRRWRDAETRRRSERGAARLEAQPAADEVLGRLEIQGLLVEELKALDEPYRSVLARTFFDGWSAARIGRESGVPAPTVRWRLGRGLTELRARLDRRQARDGISWRIALVPLTRREPWWGPASLGPGTNLVAVLQGALAMKLSTQVVLSGALVLVCGLGVLWVTKESPPPREAARPAARERPTLAAAPREDKSEGSERPATREALIADTPAAPEPQLAPALEPAALVDGRCVDRDLVPVAGAHVRMGREGDGTSAFTARDGTFAVACRGDGADRRLLRIEAEGYGTQLVDVEIAVRVAAEVASDGATHLGDIVLAPGGSVRGRVLEASGAACAGADVRVTEPALSESPDAARRHGPRADLRSLSTTTAPDGGFLLTGATAGPVRVWATAPGRLFSVSEPIDVPVHGESQEVLLTLEPVERADRLAGVVLDPAGEPVPKASLAVRCNMRREGSSTSYTRRVDEYGAFELPAPPGSSFDLTASDPEQRWLPLSRTGLEPGTPELELRFVETPWIDVLVRAGQEPVSDYAVGIGAADGSSDAGPRADHPAGRARVHAPDEPFSVVVDAPGYALERRGPFDPGAPPTTLEFELVAEPGLRGRVLVYGQPVIAARVTLHDADPRNRIDHGGYPALMLPDPLDEAHSDGEGRFVLRARNRGEFVVRAEAEGLAAGDAGPFAFDPHQGRTDLELVLTRGGAIEGRVLMPVGREAAGVIVAANRGDTHPRTLRSGEDGGFRFEGLTPGRWSVARGKLEVGSDTGTAYSPRGRAEIAFNCEVVDGQTARCDVDLRDWEPCWLSGELLANGEPARSWSLEVWPAETDGVVGDLPRATTDHEGRFGLEIEEAGAVRLTFSPPAESGAAGQLSLPFDLRPGENPWKADLSLGRLEGVASPGEGRLFYTSAEGQEPRCTLLITPDAEGRFALPIVPAGRGAIQRLTRSGGERRFETLVELEIPARGTREVRLP